MKLSVALPTFNGAQFLADQLNSLLTQDRRPDELVISDDSSVDDTLAVVESFKGKAPFPVRVLAGEDRLGCDANFGRAVAACTGEMIALCDQDDVWLSTHLSRLAAVLESNPAVGLAMSNSTYVDESLRPTGDVTMWSAARFGAADLARLRRGPFFQEWVRHPIFAGHAMAFRADLRDVLLPFDGQSYDHWIAMIAAACSEVVLIEEPLTLHRHHTSQAVANRQVSLGEHTRVNATVSEDFFLAQAAQWRSLAQRLNAFRDRWHDAGVGDVLRKKANFLERRSAMRRQGHVGRAMLAAATLLAGRYHREGRGWLTFARDLRG